MASDLTFKLTYSPEGIDPKVWVVDLYDLRTSEYEAMQKRSGIRGISDLLAGLQCADMVALKALIWIMLKKSMSDLSWESLDPTPNEVELTDPDENPGVMRAKLERMNANDELNEVGKKRLKQLIAQGVESEPEPEEDPKA